jgi:hypothetical protein
MRCVVEGRMLEREMLLLELVFERDRVVNGSKFENLGESSVDALKRVEAECDWSDAALLLTGDAPQPQPNQPIPIG